MKSKKLAKTCGLPLYLGLAAGILLLAGNILYPGVIYNIQLDAAGGTSYFSSFLYRPIALQIVEFLIYPGIFLILLLLAIKEPRRGSAFAILWIVFSALGILSLILSGIFMAPYVLPSSGRQISANAIYLCISTLLTVLGSLSLLLSCIALLKRLHQPDGFETPTAVNQ
ncbi:MAG TPA: hypothetical protein VHP31_02055 [Caproicibacter sp.]|nr:hypothetical protein [Caproicibacter sp.]